MTQPSSDNHGPFDPDTLQVLLADSEFPRLSTELIAAAVGLIGDDPAMLDLKIAGAALTEMREAYRAFAPYRGVRKVTVFGSARVKADDPLYRQAREVARCLADAGWMIITGAGPGIMAAAMEGAGRERSFGASSPSCSSIHPATPIGNRSTHSSKVSWPASVRSPE